MSVGIGLDLWFVGCVYFPKGELTWISHSIKKFGRSTTMSKSTSEMSPKQLTIQQQSALKNINIKKSLHESVHSAKIPTYASAS